MAGPHLRDRHGEAELIITQEVEVDVELSDFSPSEVKAWLQNHKGAFDGDEVFGWALKSRGCSPVLVELLTRWTDRPFPDQCELEEWLRTH